MEMIVHDPKVITNPGTTCTKTIVFKVARLALFEVMPIHMPNQQRAIRLAAVVPAAAAAVKIVDANSQARPPVLRPQSCGAELVPELVTIAVPGVTETVTVDVVTVVVALLPAAAIAW